jgi:hypothetical protein
MGRPSLAPGRYFRLLLIGYFEGLRSDNRLRRARTANWTPSGSLKSPWPGFWRSPSLPLASNILTTPSRNSAAGERVPQIVNPESFDLRSPHEIAPRRLDGRDRLAVRAREHVDRTFTCARRHIEQERDRLRMLLYAVRPLLFRVMARLRPDSRNEIELAPLRVEGFGFATAAPRERAHRTMR